MSFIFNDTLKKDLKINNKVVNNYHNKDNTTSVQYPAYKPTKNMIDNMLNNNVLIKPITNKYDESFKIKPPATYKGNLPVLPELKRDLKFWNLIC